jgi:hypothetical protein
MRVNADGEPIVNRLRLLSRKLPHAWAQIKRAAIDPFKVSSVSVERPIFIWGNGQSGTYLLYDLLSLCGALVCPSMTGWRKKGLAHLMSVKPIEGEPTLWGGVGLPWDRVPVWMHDRVLTNRDVPNVDFAVVRKRYARLHTRWPWQSGQARRVLDKSPNYVLMTELIDHAFPDALHVFALRDPEAILDSIVRRFEDPRYRVEENWTGPVTGWYGNILLPGHEQRRHWPVKERHRWQIEQVLEIGHRAADRIGRRCIKTRHEDLLAHPEAALTRLCEFVKVPVPMIPPGAIRHGAVYKRSSDILDEPPHAASGSR